MPLRRRLHKSSFLICWSYVFLTHEHVFLLKFTDFDNFNEKTSHYHWLSAKNIFFRRRLQKSRFLIRWCYVFLTHTMCFCLKFLTMGKVPPPCRRLQKMHMGWQMQKLRSCMCIWTPESERFVVLRAHGRTISTVSWSDDPSVNYATIKTFAVNHPTLKRVFGLGLRFSNLGAETLPISSVSLIVSVNMKLGYSCQLS